MWAQHAQHVNVIINITCLSALRAVEHVCSLCACTKFLPVLLRYTYATWVWGMLCACVRCENRLAGLLQPAMAPPACAFAGVVYAVYPQPQKVCVMQRAILLRGSDANVHEFFRSPLQGLKRRLRMHAADVQEREDLIAKDAEVQRLLEAPPMAISPAPAPAVSPPSLPQQPQRPPPVPLPPAQLGPSTGAISSAGNSESVGGGAAGAAVGADVPDADAGDGDDDDDVPVGLVVACTVAAVVAVLLCITATALFMLRRQQQRAPRQPPPPPANPPPQLEEPQAAVGSWRVRHPRSNPRRHGHIRSRCC